MSPAPADERMVGEASQEGGFFNHIPLFLDRTFRMIEEVPDDVVCWSTAGDSFVIKQVLMLEEILPSYFNHNKFMSFVRQLNFYGFKKTKGRSRTSACLRSTDDGARAGGMEAAAAEEESESWEEFRHPQFRRGRRDLLVGIKRQKDGGRLKRKRADAQKSDIVSSLATDVEALADELKEMKGKLDSILSLLLTLASGQHRAATPGNPVPRARHNIAGDLAAATAAAGCEVGDGGGVRSGGVAPSGGNTAAFFEAEPPATTARGEHGHEQWLVGGGGGSGSGGDGSRGGHDPYWYGARGAVLDYRATARDPADHRQQHGWYGHLPHSRLSQQPYDAGRYPVVPDQRRFQAVQHAVQPQSLPPLSAAVEVRASESASVEPSRHQLPPLYLTPPRLSDSAAASPSSARKQGGSGNAQAAHEWDTGHVVGSQGRRRRGASFGETQKGLLDGPRPTPQTLSSAAETEKTKRANSINSTSSTGSINSCSTQSSFECD